MLWAINCAHSMIQASASPPFLTPASVSSPAADAGGVAADEFDVLRPGCDRTCKCFYSVGAKNEKCEYEAMLNLAHNMKVQSANGAKRSNSHQIPKWKSEKK